MDAQLQREINDLIRKLQGLSKEVKKDSQDAFQEAAGPLVSAIKARAPQSEKPHYRYGTAKIAGGIRAPKGSGQIVATYMPGNLQRSFKTLKFRRSAAVFIGPNLAKGNKTGLFAGARTDAYYAHMVEFGTATTPPQPFVRPAVAAAGGITLRLATELLKRKIESYARANAV